VGDWYGRRTFLLRLAQRLLHRAHYPHILLYVKQKNALVANRKHAVIIVIKVFHCPLTPLRRESCDLLALFLCLKMKTLEKVCCKKKPKPIFRNTIFEASFPFFFAPTTKRGQPVSSHFFWAGVSCSHLDGKV
jgi:hypothetical protein